MQTTVPTSLRRSIVTTKIIALAAATLAFGAASSAHAASSTWNESGPGATFAWDATSNWTSGVIPGVTGGSTTNTDTATFGTTLTGTETVIIDSGRNIQNIIISNAATTVTDDYFFTDQGSLLLTAGGSISDVNSGSAPVVFANGIAAIQAIQLEGNYTFSDTAASGTATLEIGVQTNSALGGGNVTINNGGTLTLTGTQSAATINSQTNSGASIVGGNINQAVGTIAGITKTGTGTWALAGSNSYSGATTIDAGILNINILANEGVLSSLGVGNGLNSTTDLVINGGVLQYSGYSNTSGGPPNVPNGYLTNRLFTIGDASTTLNTADIDSSNVWNAAYNSVQGTIGFTNTGAIAFGGTVGNHTLTLSGLNIGTNLFDPQILDQNTSGGDITNLVKSGPGTWILGNSNSYTGTTTIAGGILGDLTGTGVSSTSALTISNGVYQSSGNIVRNLGTSAGNAQITGGRSGFSAFSSTSPGSTINLTLGGGTGGIVQFGSANFNPTEYILNAPIANSTLKATDNYDLNGGNRTIETDAATAIMSGTISNSSANTAGLNKAGNGLLELTATNSYNGLTGVSGGVLWATGAGTLGTNTGVINVGGGGELRVDSLSDIPGTVLLNHGTLGVTFNATQSGLAAILNSNSSGILALDAVMQSNALNMAALGNGAMYLGSSTNSTYSASTLGIASGGTQPDAAAANNTNSFGGTYRLGGGGGVLFITGQNVLTNQPVNLLLNNYTGTTPSQSLLTSNNYNSVVIGDGTTAGQPNGGGTIDLQNSQNYLGTTTINAGATLDLDYSGFAGGSTQGNIISSNSPILMQGGTLAITGGFNQTDTQTLGGVTGVFGSNTINVNEGITGGAASLTANLGALTANNGSTFLIENSIGAFPSTTTTTTAPVNGGLGGAYVMQNNSGLPTYGWVAETANTSGGFNLTQITTEGVLPTSGASATNDYLETATTQLTASESINLLRVTNTSSAADTLTIGQKTPATIETLTTNGILYNGNGTITLVAGTAGSSITSNSGNLYLYNYSSNSSIANAENFTASNPANSIGTVYLDLPVTGNTNVIFGGPGVFNLGASLANTGNVYLDGATLLYNNGNELGAFTGSLVINSGELAIYASTVTDTIAENQVWNGNFTLGHGGPTILGSGATDFTGTITLTNNITLTINSNNLGGGSNVLAWNVGGTLSDGGFGYGLTIGANSPSLYDPASPTDTAWQNAPLTITGTTNFTGAITVLADAIYLDSATAANRNNVLALAANSSAYFSTTTLSLAGLSDVGAASNTELIQGTSSSASAITLWGGGNYSFGGTIGNTILISTGAAATTVALNMDGQGTQTLTGSNSFTGAISANAGTLIVDASKGGSLATATLDVGGGTYEFIGASTGSGTTENFTTTNVNGNGQSKIVASGASTTLNLGNLVAATAGSVVDIAPIGSSAITEVSTSTAISNGVIGLGTVVYTNPTTGVTTWATTSGAVGNVSPIVAYTGDSTVLVTSGGNSNINYMISGSQTETANTSINLLRISNSSANTLAVNSGFTLSLKGDGLLDNGTAAYTITGGGLNATSGQLIIQNYGTGGLTIASSIVNNNATAEALVLAGTGTTFLTGTNTYTGITYFDGGTTNFNSLANFQNTPSYTFAGGTLQYATGNTADFTKTAAGGTSVINVGISGGTIDTNGNAVTWSKSFGNSGTTGGGLNFTDSFNAANPTAATGSLTIDGNITYSGLTTVSSGGVINLVGNNTGGGTIAGNGGTLEGGTTQQTSSAQITNQSDAGKLTLLAGGVIAPGSPGIGTLVNNGSNGGIQGAGIGGSSGGANKGDQNANVGNNVLEASQLQWYAGGTLTFYLDSTTTASSAAAPAASTVLNLGTGALAKMGGTGQYILNFANTGGYNVNGSPNVYDLINFGLPSLTNNFNPNGNTDFTINDFTIVNLNGVGVLSLYDNTSANGGAGQEELILTVIPEPSTWVMLIGGLATLVFWTRRKRATATCSFAKK